jgi:regulator of sigma E protease
MATLVLANLQHIVTLLIILSILVVAHEWGHFIVARLFGIRVDDFSIGFGKRLIRIGKRGDTEYNIRMLPLGGFVKIAGMAADEEPLVRAKDRVMGKEASNDPDANSMPLIAENIETDSLDHTPAPDEFGSKPLWQRSLVILAGPVMSFVLGYVVLCLMGCTVGASTGKALTRIGLVNPGGAGQKIGLRAGDTILAINGQPVRDGLDMITRINGSLGIPLTLSVRRGPSTFTKTAVPRPAKDKNTGAPVLYTDVVQPGTVGSSFGLLAGDTIRGIADEKVTDAQQALRLLRSNAGKKVQIVVTRPAAELPVTLSGTLPSPLAPNALPTLNAHPIGILDIEPAEEYRRVGFVESLRQGNATLIALFTMLASLVQHHQLQNNTGGIIYMYQATSLADENGSAERVFLLAQLSISLAIFNLLPIPILDGGHLLSFFIEWVRRGKKMTEEQQQAFLMTGLAIIGVLFVLIMTKDILRTVKGQLPQ